ncbi:MAG: polysaccharide biosynthesis protein [Gammaproteobacteria bacterium]|jgi:O-antigen/teichoic acid export membrane protein|nr:polysaccharide biosynthesis protein [Gammaproteobacteria bacterium]
MGPPPASRPGALTRNIAAGLASSAWTALLGLAVVPLYLKYLGLEAYGLIGFFATTQALFQVLDMGLAQTMNREIARCAAADDLPQGRRLLHSLAVVYWAAAAAIALLMLLLGPWIADHWLKPGRVQRESVTHAVVLMGAVIACRWPISLYQGALNGLQRLALSSAVAVGMTTLASGGAIVVLMFVSRTIEAFFIWQAVVGLIYALTIRSLSWTVLGRSAGLRFDRQQLQRVWGYSLGMGGIAISALVFTQLDKALLSKLLGLADFGRYVLASTIVAGLYVLVTPLFNAVYPRFSQLVALGDSVQLTDLYRLGTRLLSSVLFPIAVVLAVLAREVIAFWTGNEQLAGAVAPLVALLSAGSALHGVMYFPFALQLAYGLPRVALTINLVLLVVQVPLVITCAYSMGALGGALSWLVLHVLYLLLGTWLTHRQVLPGIGRKWLLLDVGVPLCVALLLAAVLRYAVVPLEWPPALKLLTGAALGVTVIAAEIATSPRMYSVLARNIRPRTSPM